MQKAISIDGGFVRLGRFWFQNRSVSPLPILLCVLVFPPQITWDFWGHAILITGILLAEAVRLWSVGFAGSATRTRGDSVPGLVHAGPYRYVRNPLYVANILLYTFCSLLFGFTWLTVFAFAYFAVQYVCIVAYEESILHQHFSSEYKAYCRQVPRWMPLAQPKIESSSHQFNAWAALRSERSTLIAIVVIGFLYIAKRAFLY